MKKTYPFLRCNDDRIYKDKLLKSAISLAEKVGSTIKEIDSAISIIKSPCHAIPVLGDAKLILIKKHTRQLIPKLYTTFYDVLLVYLTAVSYTHLTLPTN